MPQSPRSGRQHKAWGASPRIIDKKTSEPAQRATARRCFGLSAASRAQSCFRFEPGAGAPGFMLSPAPRALMFLSMILLILSDDFVNDNESALYGLRRL